MKLNRSWPIIVFAVFFASLIGAFLYYWPGWGLQDDAQSLEIARLIWGSGHFWATLWEIIKGDLASWGIFRPIYYFTVAVNYHFFKDAPWVLYIFVTVFNFCALLLWGKLITRLFALKEDEKFIGMFLFPLSFFIFTPFWNIFTHISFQEKYIVLFSAAAFYFLEKAYRENRAVFLTPVVISIFLGLLSKPTGIHLTLTFGGFALADLLFFKFNKRLSRWVLLLSAVIFISYYLFIKMNLRGYAGQYSLSLGSIVENLLHAPLVIQLLILVALVMSLTSILTTINKKNPFSPLVLMIPAGFLSYVLILAPWRLVNYLFSALTPYVLIMFFPFFLWCFRKNKGLRFLANAGLIFLVFMSFFFIGVPRVSKLADIRQMQAFIASSEEGHYHYFFPPPFSEAAEAIGTLTSREIHYLQDGVLSEEHYDDTKINRLIVNDEAAPVSLKGVQTGEAVYQNKTWKVIGLRKDGENTGTFQADFPENCVQRLKSFLRDL